MNARTAPRGSKDELKDIPSKDCAMCSPVSGQILESIPSLFF